MSRPRMFLSRAVLGAALTIAAAATSAQAETICVNRVGCDHVQPTTGTLGAQLQGAITYAATTPAADVIKLGDGTYDNGKTFYYVDAVGGSGGGSTLTIEGGGSSAVTLRNTGTTVDDETVEGDQNSPALTLRDLTIEGPPFAQHSLGVELGSAASVLDGVRLIAPPQTPVATALEQAVSVRYGATITGSTIQGFDAGIIPITGPYPKPLTVSRSTIDVHGDAVELNTQGGTLRRVTLRSDGAGATALRVAGQTTVENSILEGPQAFAADCFSPSNLRYVTIRATGPDGVHATCTASTTTPPVAIADSILAPGTTVAASAGGSFLLTRSRWDGTSTGSVTATSMTTAQPGFVSATDLHLAPGSPLIDAGAVNGSSTAEPYVGGDRDGSLRVVDGNGMGGAQPDLGAYEAPVGTTPTPTTPGPTTPKPTTPKPTTPKPTTPAPTTPAPTTPAPTTPGPTTPKPTSPAPTSPKPTTPPVTPPMATTPPVTTPEATTPPVTTPEATTPPVTTPEATTPPVTTPEATTPAPLPPAGDPPAGGGGGTSFVEVPWPMPTPTPPAPGAPQSTIPNYSGVRLSGGSVRVDSKGRVKIRVSCPAIGAITRCSGSVELRLTTGKGKRAKTTTVGRKSVSVAPGKGTDVLLTVKSGVRPQIKGKGLKFTLRATTHDVRPSPVTVVTTAPLTVRPGTK